MTAKLRPRRGGHRHHPAPLRQEVKNLAIVVEDEPSAELLDEMEMDPDDMLFGLYQGVPLPERVGTMATPSRTASPCSRP